MKNKLSSIKIKADYAVASASAARHQVDHPGSLWYHAIGLLSAFYALNEELRKHTQNGPDCILRDAVKCWRDRNSDAVEGFFGNARNDATHQGALVSEPYVEWEEDPMNDTKHPQPRAHITIRGSKIDKMPASEFIGLCECALIFFREGIVSIDEDYKRRGGIEHRLPETTRLDALF